MPSEQEQRHDSAGAIQLVGSAREGQRNVRVRRASAKDLRDAIQKAYRAGDKDLIDALDAERAYRDRVRATLGNLTDYWQALNKLNAAVGLKVLSAKEADRESILEDAIPAPKAP